MNDTCNKIININKQHNINNHINIPKQGHIFEMVNPVNKKQTHTIKEFSLKENNFNPSKGSPNLFMTKLEFRMNNYFKEVALNNDTFKL